jgi:hypothetical protein
MSLRKINIKNSFFCKKDFFDALDFVYLAICFCCNCAIFNKFYYISNNSKKYIKCVQSSYNYNITIFSISIKQIYKKQLRLKKEIRKAHIKLSCLKKQLNF